MRMASGPERTSNSRSFLSLQVLCDLSLTGTPSESRMDATYVASSVPLESKAIDCTMSG